MSAPLGLEDVDCAVCGAPLEADDFCDDCLDCLTCCRCEPDEDL